MLRWEDCVKRDTRKAGEEEDCSRVADQPVQDPFCSLTIGNRLENVTPK